MESDHRWKTYRRRDALEHGPRERTGKRILVVDDEEAFCGMLRDLLAAHGHEIRTETDPRRALDQLRDGDFDALILDLVMPKLSGLEVLRLVREEYPVIAIVVLTGHASLEKAVEAMRLGASDFLSKPVQPVRLNLRLERACEFERARRLADADALTGLYNHRCFHERLQEEVCRAQRYDRPLSLMMIDIDGFKAYNDTYGHPQGDEVLIGLAEVLGECSRGSDLVARLGGDEFCLILPETTAEETEIVAHRIRTRMQKLSFSWEDGRLGPPTISVGIGACHAETSKESLIAETDKALFRSKKTRRRSGHMPEVERSAPAADGCWTGGDS